MTRLVWTDREATVIQITTRYNWDLLGSIWTMKQKDYSSKRHTGECHSCQLRTGNWGFNTHQNWTVEDWKNVAWSDGSRFLPRHSGSEFGVNNMKAWETYLSIVADNVHAFIVQPSSDGYFQHHTRLKSSLTGFFEHTL